MVTSNPMLKRDAAWAGTVEDRTMDLNGTVNKTGILLLICAATAYVGWTNPEMSGVWLFGGLIGGLVLSMVGIFVPKSTPIVAPLYAAAEGLVLGAISQILNSRYHGIAASAVLMTFSVLAIFLALYATRLVRVTNGMRVAVIAATGGVCLVYVVCWILSFFGIQASFIYGNGLVSIGVSVLVCAIAAFNFFLDFDAIENRIRAGSPKYMEWYSSMALMITIVWLYLEILRLLAKLQSRR